MPPRSHRRRILHARGPFHQHLFLSSDAPWLCHISLLLFLRLLRETPRARECKELVDKFEKDTLSVLYFSFSLLLQRARSFHFNALYSVIYYYISVRAAAAAAPLSASLHGGGALF
jgi:hypothetical protein